MPRLRTILPLLTLTVAAATATRPAQARWAWSALGTGCARDIAVGPNNVPWIIGCDNGVNAAGAGGVYYLKWGGSNFLSGPTLLPSWEYDNFEGINIAVASPGPRSSLRRKPTPSCN